MAPPQELVVTLEGKVIRVLLAEEREMVRGAFLVLLAQESDIDVVANLGYSNGILSAARLHRPEVAVIGMDMPSADDLSIVQKIHDEIPETRTLILTNRGHPGAVRQALKIGVGGFLHKDSPPEKLVSTIRDLAAGHRVIDADLAVSAWQTPPPPLTERELEVLRLVATGSAVPDIAAQLHLSPGTIRNYLTTAESKLNARTRVDAVRIAVDAGWL
ncbi:DNA-binding response regulator [Streptomyces sp. NPDC048436]|uniref:response regulator transcription factor n=1 Tax=Streptomyces sp. NPDC048436 TaxID=3365550 RepID=UPI0037164D57